MDAHGTVGLGNGSRGIYIQGTASIIITGTVITDNVVSDSGSGITGVRLDFDQGTVIQGNEIGTDATGTIALGNGLNGLLLVNSVDDIVGGVNAGDGNVLSANGNYGLRLQGATGTIVQGNFIGTDATGTIALGNVSGGISIDTAATGNTIGGTTVGARNVISGNRGDGMDIAGTGTTGNVVEGNYIGTNAAGADLLPSEVAWYQAENNANDSAGGNNGTLEGNISYNIGIVRQAFDLMGTNGYVDIPYSASLTPSTAITVEAWIDPATLSAPSPTGGWDIFNQASDGGRNPLPGQNVSGGAGGYILRVMNDGSVVFVVGVAEGGNPYRSVQSAPGLVTPGVFSHIAGTYDSATGKLTVYVNGVATTTTTSGTLNQDPIALKLGGDLFNQTFFNGLIDEAAVYSTALSAAQIQRIVQLGSQGKAGLFGNANGVAIFNGASNNTIGTTQYGQSFVTGNAGLSSPFSITAAPGGDLYVTETSNPLYSGSDSRFTD